MARWALKEKHYLRIPGTEWEYKETNEATGRQARKVFEVPLHLDPEYPGDQNYPDQVIVTNKPDPTYPRDYHFLGDPTPEMEPLDAEASAISASLQPKWSHPIEDISDDSLSQDLAAFRASRQVVSLEEFNDMKAQLAVLTELLKSQPRSERRV